MTITCDCSVDHGEYPEFYKETFPKARKLHKCIECGENILPGQNYNNYKGKWDGEFRIYHTCIPCNSIRKHYCKHGFIFGNLMEQIWDCFGFDYTSNEFEDDN